MSKSDTLKMVVKKVAPKATYGTDPTNPWSMKANIDETASLDAYLSARGFNPKFASKDVKIAHSKSNEFLKWKRDHAMGESMTTTHTPVAQKKHALSKSKSVHKEIRTDGGMHPQGLHGESLGDDFLKMMKDKGIKHRVHGTPDQEKQRTMDKLAANKAKADATPKSTKKDDQGGFGTHRGYGQGRYMGDSVELEGQVIEAKDPEYSDPYMAVNQLRTIMHNAQEMIDLIGTDTDLPEWVESKITLAEDYIMTVANYMRSELKEETLDEVRMSAAMKLSRAFDREKAKSTASIQRGKELMDKIKQDVKAKSEKPPIKEDRMKSARIIKSIYKKKNMKEEMYDHEKDDKGGQSYGKPPKVGKSKAEGEDKTQAAAILKGGTTLTGQGRDTIEIDPMMRTRPTNGASPETDRSKKSIG
jgi:hypothetical protein